MLYVVALLLCKARPVRKDVLGKSMSVKAAKGLLSENTTEMVTYMRAVASESRRFVIQKGGRIPSLAC